MRNQLTVLAALMLTLGCNSNPYSGVTDRLSPKPVESKPGNSAFGVDVASATEIPEGKTTSIKMVGHVPSPGVPVIVISGLPTWAQYNPSTQTLDCNPPLGAGVGADPTHAYAIYKAVITISSSDAPVAKSAQEISIIVRHESQASQIDLQTPAQIQEGITFQGIISVTNSDFPVGPFVISGVNLPAGMTIVPDRDPTKFYVSYRPSYSVVNSNNYDRTCRDASSSQTRMCITSSWTINVVDPRGGITTKTIAWDVLDTRLNPTAVVPTGLVGYAVNSNGVTTLTADFEVPVADLNGEIFPQVTADPVNVGSVAVTSSVTGGGGNTGNPYTLVRVIWSDVPSFNKGSTQNLTLRSCVYDSMLYMNQCTSTPVSIQF